MGRKSKFSKEIKIKACEDYKNRKGNFKQIAKEIGCNKETVRLWFLSYVVNGSSTFNVSNKYHFYSEKLKRYIVNLYIKRELSVSEIKAKYGVPNNLVYNWIRKYNKGIKIASSHSYGDIYHMKSRKATCEEKLEIAKWVISNNMNYRSAAEKFAHRYSNVCL